MFNIAIFIHYFSVVFACITAAFGVSVGQATAIKGMLEGTNRQPTFFSEITKTMLFGLFIIEGSFVLSFITAFMILFSDYKIITLPIALAELGSSMAVGLSSAFVGIAAGNSILSTCKAISRQPFFIKKIQMFLLIILTLIETPVFFSFIMALIILNSISQDISFADGMRLFSAGLAVGIGSIGPSISQAIFAREACLAIGISKESFKKVFTFSILTEALIETPILLSFLISIFMFFNSVSPIISENIPILGGFSFLAVALSVGFGTLGTAIGVGKVGSKAVESIGITPSAYQSIFKVAFLSQVLIETGGLFAFLISLLILGKVSF